MNPSDDSLQRDQSIESQIAQSFGGFRAEWLKGQLFDLFTEPSYFPELQTSRPCILIGGRGTGKTTVLRCLSYTGQFALSQENTKAISSWSYYGLYYRVNTNRVMAFNGPEISEEKWIKVFAHYLNLLLCGLTLDFLKWYEDSTNSELKISESQYATISSSLHLDQARNLDELNSKVKLSRVELESFINNVASSETPRLSLQGQPLDILFDCLLKLPEFSGKNFFFLLDEYENFLPYQQKIVNTIIKHSGELYTFKVGVRELGIKEKATLNPNEQLISPSDYVKINISDKLTGDVFNKFARKVCNERISWLRYSDKPVSQDIIDLLPGLSEDDEALILGIEENAAKIKSELSKAKIFKKQELKFLDELPPLQVFLIKHWSDSHNLPLEDTYKDFIDNRRQWDTRYLNYKHSLLYAIRQGKTGIQKYYAGWDVFTHLAAGNIRYLLELVVQSLLLHIQKGKLLTQPIEPELQTEAAQQVGRKYLSELEGLTVYGAQLSKMLLGLGRIFGVMAANPGGRAPEQNQFYIPDSDESQPTQDLLNSAVMHLALLRFPGNKLSDEGDTREYDYMVHPIYSPFFVFSYRRKRKIKLSAEQFLGLIKKPKLTITNILKQKKRSNADIESVPEQLSLFEAYYNENYSQADND